MYRARFLVSREPRWASVVPWHWSYVFGCCSEAGGPSCSVASEKSTDQTTPTDDNAHLDNTTETTSTSDLIHMWHSYEDIILVQMRSFNGNYSNPNRLYRPICNFSGCCLPYCTIFQTCRMSELFTTIELPILLLLSLLRRTTLILQKRINFET